MENSDSLAAICTVCGYIYDPKLGDEAHGVPPGTPWEALPADWHCPDCIMPKDKFDLFLQTEAAPPSDAGRQ
jgi:rubredoxin